MNKMRRKRKTTRRWKMRRWRRTMRRKMRRKKKTTRRRKREIREGREKWVGKRLKVD